MSENNTIQAIDDVPYIYIGPTIRNKIKQYTVYTGGTPKALIELTKEVPAIGALFVSVDKLQEAKQELMDKTSVLSVMYEHVVSYFKDKRE